LRSGPAVSRNSRWIGSSEASPVTASCEIARRSPDVASAASAAMVGFSNNCRVVMPMPAWFARDTAWMERIESPPMAKKLSSMPTRSSLSSFAQIPASFSSVSLRGATYADDECHSGSGRARRSILPLGLIGRASITTNADGTM
jgi:hypothetical protein